MKNITISCREMFIHDRSMADIPVPSVLLMCANEPAQYLIFQATLSVITYVTPWFGVAAVVALFLYILVINYFRNVSRESKRLESVARSPVYAHYSETLGGTCLHNDFIDLNFVGVE